MAADSSSTLEQRIDVEGRDPRVSAETRAVLRELMLDLHTDLERRERIEAHFTQRLRWSVVLLGLIAVLAGGLMYHLIDQMDSHMQTMSQQMQRMTASVAGMHAAVAEIGADTHRIVEGLGQIEQGMLAIEAPMRSLPAMQQDVGRIGHAVISMGAEMNALRAEVGGINASNAIMRRPFRVMDGFLP